MTELNKDLRTLYFPSFNFRADVDQLCLDYAKIVARSRSTAKHPVVESEFDDIFNNSLKIKETTVQQKRNIIKKLKPGANITLNPKPLRATRSVKQSLIQFKPPNDANWYELFNSFCNLRVSSTYTFDNKDIKAVTVGRPNHEAINTSLNRGGCGLTALMALGILTFDDYRVAFSCKEITNKKIGIDTSTLITLLDNNLPGSNISSLICAETFIMTNNTDSNGFAVMEDYLKRNLIENCATILRFGDEKGGKLDEKQFGHTIIVYKFNRRLYFFDAWTATLLTFKQKNTNPPEVNSIYASPHFFSYDEFTLRKIREVMDFVDHTKRTIFQLFELNGTGIEPFDSPFRIREWNVLSIMQRTSANIVSSLATHWHSAAVARRSLTVASPSSTVASPLSTVASPSSTSLTAQVGQTAVTLRSTLRSIKFNIFGISTNGFELILSGLIIVVTFKILISGGNKTRKNRSKKNKTRKNKNRNRKNKNKTRKYKR
jgi:hypothetical protein